jgi:hypothetical protein
MASTPSKERILAAAKELFLARGYAKQGNRDKAEVDFTTATRLEAGQ